MQGVFNVVPEVTGTVLISFHSFILYSVLQQRFPPICFPAHLFSCLVYSDIDSVQCIFSVKVLFICLFFKASSSLLNIFLSFWSAPPFFFWDRRSSLLSKLWILCQIHYLSLVCLPVLLEFYLIPFSGTYFSAISFCVTFYIHGLCFLGFRIIILLGCGFCPPISKAGPTRLVHASWWVELGSIPLEGRAVSKGVFTDSRWLRTALVSLSPDWWGCVLTLLVVWPEAFHHWNLQAVGWGKILVPKWQPPGKLTLKRIPWVSTISVLVPRVSHRLPLSPSWGPPRPTSRSGPRSYGVIALPLVPVHMKPCLFPPRVESVSPSPVEPLYSSSTGLQSQIALGAPPHDARPAGWGVWNRALTSHSCARTSVI